MDSQATSSASPEAMAAAMLQNATIDKAEGNEFSNIAGDMFKIVLNNYNTTKQGENFILGSQLAYNCACEGSYVLPDSSDAINFFQNVVLPFLAEVRKDDKSPSTVAETTGTDGSDPVSQAATPDHTVEGDPVDLMDIVPSEPSSFVRFPLCKLSEDSCFPACCQRCRPVCTLYAQVFVWLCTI